MAHKNINRFYPLFYLSLLWCAAYHRLYYRRFEVMGRRNIPKDKPVIFAACHQNALMDALAVIFAARRQIVFLARADIFKRKIIAGLLHFIRILPVYRKRDGYSSLSQNEETFDEVNQVLKRRIPVGIFPEGLHLGMKKLKPLRKGIARMAFQAEAEADFRLGLQIVPVGLDYSDYCKAGSDLLVLFGRPIRVADYKEKYLQNQATGLNSLLDDLAVAMNEVMIDIRPEEEYEEILHGAENYAEAEIKKQRLRDNLRNRFFLKKQITERINHAYEEQSLVFKDLCNEMTSHRKNSPHATRIASESKDPAQIIEMTSHFLIALLLFPLSIYGALINLIPFLITIKFAGKIRDPHFVSSVRFGLGFILFNLWYLVLTLAIILFVNNIFLAFALIISWPVSGWLSFYYFRFIKKILTFQN